MNEPQALLIEHIADLLRLDPATIIVEEGDDAVTITLTQDSLGPIATEALKHCKYIFSEDKRFENVEEDFEVIEERVRIDENMATITCVDNGNTLDALNRTFLDVGGLAAQGKHTRNLLIERAVHLALEQVLKVEPSIEFMDDICVSPNQDAMLPGLEVSNVKGECTGMSDFLGMFMQAAGIPHALAYSFSSGDRQTRNGALGKFIFTPDCLDSLYDTIVSQYALFAEQLGNFWQDIYLPALQQGVVQKILDTIQQVHPEAQIPDLSSISPLLLPASTSECDAAADPTALTPLKTGAFSPQIITDSGEEIPLADVVRSTVESLGHSFIPGGGIGVSTGKSNDIKPYGTWETLARLRSNLQVGMSWYGSGSAVSDIEKIIRHKNAHGYETKPGSSAENPRIGPGSEPGPQSIG